MPTVEDLEDVEARAAIAGARRAMACVSHELSGPLMALQTHLKLAQRRHADASIETALRCVDRIREITTTLQRASKHEPSPAVITDLATTARTCSSPGRTLPIEVLATPARRNGARSPRSPRRATASISGSPPWPRSTAAAACTSRTSRASSPSS